MKEILRIHRKVYGIPLIKYVLNWWGFIGAWWTFNKRPFLNKDDGFVDGWIYRLGPFTLFSLNLQRNEVQMIMKVLKK